MPKTNQKIERFPLRDDVYEAIRERILHGQLAAGERIVEAQLAAELGVSRTPIREALFRLEREGFTISNLARGFSVQPLTIQEVREVYPILWTLEGLALQSSGLLAGTNLPLLKQINQQFAAPGISAEAALACDTRFHETLIAGCSNQRVLEMLGSLRKVIERYERVYMRDVNLVATSVQQHQAILTALAERNLEQAVAAIETNWRFGMESLLLQITT